MGFGLSFGKSKQKSTTDSTMTKAEDSLQSGLESTQQQQSTSSSGTSSTTSQSSGTSQTSQTQQQQSSSQATTTQSGTQKSFSDALAGTMESGIATLLGGFTGTNQALADSLGTLQNFDADSYVADVMAQAEARENMNLEQAINGMYSSIGGEASNNSMAALLAQRLTGDSAANLAGIRGQAEGQAQGILQSAAKTITDALGTQAAGVSGVAGALKGGNVTTEGRTVADEIAQLLGTTSGLTQTSEQSNQQTQTQQDTISNLVGLVSQLLSTSTDTVATENSVTKGKKSGGGLSLSI